MRVSSIAALLSGASLAAATPLAHSERNDGYNGIGNAGYKGRVGPSTATCTQEYYEISVTSMNTVFENVLSNANETYLTYLLSQFVAQLPATMGNFTEKYEAPAKEAISGTYTISGTLCTPLDGDEDDGAIQLLVHGIGFDSSYWDFAATDEDYSYVSAAAQAGHTTFHYDRLGTGLSEKPEDAYNTVQAATDVAILSEIISMLQNGKIGGKKYSKLAAVGKFSVQLNYITQTLPKAFDTVVLTGFSANTTAVPLYQTSAAYSTASIVAPSRFPATQFTNAYLITLSAWTNQLNFAWFGHYSNDAINLARATEQPVTQGVLFTFGALSGKAPMYKGNVHVVTGDRDWIFCELNCIFGAPPGVASIPALVSEYYPSAASFSTYIPAEVGHAINIHQQAPQVYQEILSYLNTVFY
ncbi:MAG: hypothetical protein CYPHOPRED_001494 [Cyphobasidiales sp. Tagirdzhanova-0007]|nr:MAG: hypothetical protein CYPHOPRED_001494 [Cyphobasidiales sp. Tagirdzhanova-0007]